MAKCTFGIFVSVIPQEYQLAVAPASALKERLRSKALYGFRLSRLKAGAGSKLSFPNYKIIPTSVDRKIVQSCQEDDQRVRIVSVERAGQKLLASCLTLDMDMPRIVAIE